jgi:Rrf2 family protein
MMMDLARHFGTGPESLAEIARHEALSATYLEQLAAKLRKAGLVTSYQGARGGYQLSRPPADITVGDVMRVLEERSPRWYVLPRAKATCCVSVRSLQRQSGLGTGAG